MLRVKHGGGYLFWRNWKEEKSQAKEVRSLKILDAVEVEIQGKLLAVLRFVQPIRK